MTENLMKNNMLELFKEFNKNRIDYNVRKWETLKFFQSIFSALTVASVGGIITAISLNVINDILVLVGLLLLPVCSCIALWVGMRNLKRESRLLYIEEASMFKLLKFISLPNKVPEDKRWIPGDEFLLPIKYRDYKYGIDEKELNKKEQLNFDDWLKLRMKGHLFSHLINLLFISEILVSLFLVIAIILYFLLS